ncbi:MAG: GNAT family protein [Bacteroidota bacterium]
MDFSINYVLENSKVRLEPLTEAHSPKLKPLTGDTTIWTYFLGRSNGQSDFDFYIRDAIAHRHAKKEYPFAVFDKSVGQYCGSTRFFDYSEAFRNIKLGYTWYGKMCRGTGLNKHCKFLLFEFAFEKLGLERIGLGAHSENSVSIAAMKSVGCTHEGVLRKIFPAIHNKDRADCMLFSILKEDWTNGIKNQLKGKL